MARTDEQVGRDYARAQLARALATADAHEDAATRARGRERASRWRDVLRGMAFGSTRVGSRAPVRGLPGWVSLEIVRGGFATGRPAARGRTELAEWLSERGLAALEERLASGAYEVPLPEHAALLTVAWLGSVGDTEAAVALVDELRPLADAVVFAPEPGRGPAELDVVWRATAGEAGDSLKRRTPNRRVATMREALEVWNPLADEMLALWLETDRTEYPDGWIERARELLARYRRLAAEHTLCGKHRREGENLWVLRVGLSAAVEGSKPPRLLQHAIDSMLRKRGAPGSASHAAVRSAQAAVVAQPTHHALGRVVVRRLAALADDRGVEDIEPLLVPVAAGEAHGIPTGTEIPRSVRKVVERTLAGTPEALIERGLIPSAEVLAELVPRIAAATVALAYPDERLRTLMAANYEAFRRRRTLLLLDLESQVRVDELPWVRAVAPYRDEVRDDAAAAVTRLAELTLDAFPATVLPNPMISELGTLAAAAGLSLPLTEELAADIFMGTFTAKFVRAAKLAGELLGGSLYERYYAIDYAAVGRIERPSAFAVLCQERTGFVEGHWSVAVNGMVIEQAQILTTHNLAALTGPFGVAAQVDHAALAARCRERILVLERRLHGNPRPLAMAKDLAYAWRQMVFFLSALSQAEQAAFASAFEPPERLRPALAGLEVAIAGGSPEPLLGWTTGRHRLL